MTDLFHAADGPPADGGELPRPAERVRLRKAAGLTQGAVAAELGVRREAVVSWESGRNEPRPPHRAAYARLLAGLADRFPEVPGTGPETDDRDTRPRAAEPAAPRDSRPASGPRAGAVAERGGEPGRGPAPVPGPGPAPGPRPDPGGEHGAGAGTPAAAERPAGPPAKSPLTPSSVTPSPVPAGDAQAGDAPAERSPAPVPAGGLAAPAPVPSFSADTTADGELVEGERLPCARCGRPTPFRVGGRPEHLGGFCAPAREAGEPPVAAAGAGDPEAAPPQRPRPEGAARSGRRTSTGPGGRSGPGPARRTPPRRAAGAGRPGKPADGPSEVFHRRPARLPRAEIAAERFPGGPLAVVDTDGRAWTAHVPGGREIPCPGGTIVDLVTWALGDAGLGAPRLHPGGRDGDPLVVLTPAASLALGLPERLEDRRFLRLPEKHPVVRRIVKAGWRLTRRGFGPWPYVILPEEQGRRASVQFAVLAWDALDSRAWGDAAELPPGELADVLGRYSARVLTPRGSAAVCGLELMTALRPPTQAVKDETAGVWRSAPVPGSLTTAVDPAPPEAPDEHPVAQDRAAGDVLDEEAYDWTRDLALVGDDERELPYAVGVDVNTAFLAAASRLSLGLSAPRRVIAPDFDRRLPGCWYVDLSGVELDPRLPSPFTPHGARPDGPAWYATPTVAYAAELGADVRPSLAWVRDEHGPYLHPWHTRLRDAYVATMADLGVTADLDAEAFLAAMDGHRDRDPAAAMVLGAIKATVKGGIGKLRERAQGAAHRPGERWPALERPTWRPDIRAAVIAAARVNMHRKMANVARHTGRYPLAVLSDCVVYAGAGPSPLDVLAYDGAGAPLPGTFRLGVSPGMVKHEGTRPMAWALEVMAEGINPARHVKGVDAVLEGE